jgi:hypothetical protein
VSERRADEFFFLHFFFVYLILQHVPAPGEVRGQEAVINGPLVGADTNPYNQIAFRLISTEEKTFHSILVDKRFCVD